MRRLGLQAEGVTVAVMIVVTVSQGVEEDVHADS